MIPSLPGLVLSLLLLFLEFLDLLFELFDLFSVPCEAGEVGPEFRDRVGPRRGPRVELPRTPGQARGLFEGLQRLVELLFPDLTLRGGDLLLALLMDPGPQIVVGTGGKFPPRVPPGEEFPVEPGISRIPGKLELAGQIVHAGRIGGDHQLGFGGGLHRVGVLFPRPREQKGPEEQKKGSRRHLLLGNEHEKHEEEQSGREGPGKLLHRDPALDVFPRGAVEPGDGVRQFFHPRVGDGGAAVDPARFRGKGGELFFVEARRHHLAGSVPDESRPLLPPGDDRAVDGIAQSDDEERNVSFLQFPDERGTVALQFLAVGEEHDGPVAAFGGGEGLFRHLKRLFQIGAAHGDGIGGKFIHVFVEGHRVRGERAAQKGAPGEGDQPETVPLLPRTQLPQDVPGVFQPRGGDVGGVHAAGNVAEDHDVPPLGLEGEKFRRHGGPGGGDDQRRRGADEEQMPPDPRGAGKVDRVGGVRIGSQQGLELLLPPVPADDGDDGHQQKGHDQQVKPVGFDESHFPHLLTFPEKTFLRMEI